MTDAPPSSRYMDIIIKGAEEIKLDPLYIENLKLIPRASVPTYLQVLAKKNSLFIGFLFRQKFRVLVQGLSKICWAVYYPGYNGRPSSAFFLNRDSIRDVDNEIKSSNINDNDNSDIFYTTKKETKNMIKSNKIDHSVKSNIVMQNIAHFRKFLSNICLSLVILPGIHKLLIFSYFVLSHFISFNLILFYFFWIFITCLPIFRIFIVFIYFYRWFNYWIQINYISFYRIYSFTLESLIIHNYFCSIISKLLNKIIIWVKKWMYNKMISVLFYKIMTALVFQKLKHFFYSWFLLFVINSICIQSIFYKLSDKYLKCYICYIGAIIGLIIEFIYKYILKKSPPGLFGRPAPTPPTKKNIWNKWNKS